MPFADYDDFDDCVAQNQDKDDPDAYCAAIKRDVAGEAETDEFLDAAIRDAPDVSQSSFDPVDLDLAAVTTDVLVRAEADGKVIWMTPDGAVAYQARVDADGAYVTAEATTSEGESPADTTDHDHDHDHVSMKGPATALANTPTQPADITKAGTNEIDTEALPEAYQAALEADDFIIYGKASIEQWDDDDMPTLIEMDALEDALERFFESEAAPGIISRYHQDIPVGKPVREYTLDEATELTLSTPDDDPETYSFEAGDTLRSHVEDGDGDGRPELWLASNLAADTEPAKRARLLALQGDLDGYSVTIHRNRDELTQEGRRVTKCDLHAVTLGTGEQIKNAGSTFDVAEFKSTLRAAADLPGETYDAITQAVTSALR